MMWLDAICIPMSFVLENQLFKIIKRLFVIGLLTDLYLFRAHNTTVA